MLGVRQEEAGKDVSYAQWRGEKCILAWVERKEGRYFRLKREGWECQGGYESGGKQGGHVL